jgi:hypothetical protein
MTSKACCSLAAGLAALLLASAPACALSPVDCATVDLDLADAKAVKTCSEGDVHSKMWHGTTQMMRAQGNGYFWYVHLDKAGARSNVPDVDVRDIAADVARGLFVAPSLVIAHETVLVTAHDTVAGYDIASFSGRLRAEPKRALDCFVFARSGGWNNLSGTPGYANSLYGGYCTNKGISDSTIERVLSELRAPVE